VLGRKYDEKFSGMHYFLDLMKKEDDITPNQNMISLYNLYVQMFQKTIEG